MSILTNRERNAWDAPDVKRGPYGSVLWPDNTREAFYQMCDLARILPDGSYCRDIDGIKDRLWQFGEATKRRTVTRILTAMDRGWDTWR